MSVVEAAEGGINGILGKVFWSVEELPEQHNGKILETATMEYSKCLKDTFETTRKYSEK